MRKSFAKVQAPMFAGVVKEETPDKAICAILNSAGHGATGIDLHLSCLSDEYKNIESIKRIVEASPLPILALNYNQSLEKGFYADSEENRTALLFMGIEAGAAALDMQGYTFDLPSKTAFNEKFYDPSYSFLKKRPKEVVLDSEIIARQTALIERVHSLGGEVLLSNHLGVALTAEELCEFASFIEKRNPDIIKIVTPAETEEEAAEGIRAMIMLKKEIKTPISYHCSGKAGRITRLVNPAMGGFMCFCNDRFTPASDKSQPLLEVAKAVIDNIKKAL